MKKATQKKRSTLVNGSVETQSYIAWIADLKRRYRATQIKAAVAVNSALIDFYWNLGKDITEKFAEEAGYGSRFFENVSFDMRTEFPNDTGFSPRNIRYCQDFYRLYSAAPILPQVVAKSAKGKPPSSPTLNPHFFSSARASHFLGKSTLLKSEARQRTSIFYSTSCRCIAISSWRSRPASTNLPISAS